MFLPCPSAAQPHSSPCTGAGGGPNGAALDASPVSAARRAYRLSIGLTLGPTQVQLLVPTPYHTPAHRRWTPAPAALAGALRGLPGADARWRVAWARGSGDEIRAVVQGLLERGDEALRQELCGVYLGALAEGRSPDAASEIASAWLQDWMMAEDLGVDEVGFALVAAGLRGHVRGVADLLVGTRQVAAGEVLPGDLAVDRGGVAVGVVERGPRPLLRASRSRARPGRGAAEAAWEILIAHALPGDDGRLGPRCTRLWLAPGQDEPSGDGEGAGFRAFYRPVRPVAPEPELTSACCPR